MSAPLLPPAPPLRCVVVAWTLCVESAEPKWQIIFANGDETAGRARAAEWLERNPDSECQLLLGKPEDRARIVPKVGWGR